MHFDFLDADVRRGTENRQELEIYVHIPFCVRKCDYCDFLSAPATEEGIDRYIHALCKEISFHKEMAQAYIVTTVFIGGGTPSILSSEQITKVMRMLRRTFLIAEDAEITIECNPGTVTKEKARCYKMLGINRISLGLQSTQNYELKGIGRIHTYEEFLDSYYIFRECGFSNINIDLMSGLPNQSLDSYKDSLDRVISLEPEHISVYSLILEEGTKLFDRVQSEKAKGLSSLPDEDTADIMYGITREKLEQAGYHRYEISNYAKTGYECRHNIGYWIRTPYLGLGLGAASLVEESRFSKVTDLRVYMETLEKDQLTLAELCQEVKPLSVKEQMEEYMFLGLRMIKGVSKQKFAEKFGVTMEDVYGKVIRTLDINGLVEQDEEYLWLSQWGMDVSNQVMAEFLLD